MACGGFARGLLASYPQSAQARTELSNKIDTPSAARIQRPQARDTYKRLDLRRGLGYLHTLGDTTILRHGSRPPRYL